MKMYIIVSFILLGIANAGRLELQSKNMSRPNAHNHRRMFQRTPKATSQFLDCYDYTNMGGSYLRANDYIPNLANYNFDNKIESCCFTGIWILFAEQSYNGMSTGSANWWAYGSNYCTDVPSQFFNQATSLRFTGAPDDWKFATLNLYFNDYFIGDEEFMYQDMAQLNYDNRARSIIVTGCQPWTVYQYDNYQGYSMCVYPGDTSSCNPGFYTTSQSLGSLSGQISSARRGCYAKEKVFPDNYGARTLMDKNGAQGFFSEAN